MIIESVKIHVVEKALRRAFSSSMETVDRVRHVLVRMEMNDPGGAGFVGWGEAPTPLTPRYMGETAATVVEQLASHLVPAVRAKRWDSPSDLAALLAAAGGSPSGRHAMEMAAWDGWCRFRGLPLAAALAGSHGPAATVPAGCTIGQIDVAALPGAVAQCVDEGYRRIKLKISPGRDVEVMAIARAHCGDAEIVADANGAYRLEDPDELAALHAMDALGLAALEQPLAADDLVGHARLRELIRTPIALDESVTSPGSVSSALGLGSCSAVSIKAARLGGIVAAMETARAAVEGGVGVWCGGMHELGPGRAANIALAATPGFGLIGDLAASGFYFDSDIVEPPATVVAGELAVPTAPGLGCEMDEDAVAAFSVHSVELA